MELIIRPEIEFNEDVENPHLKLNEIFRNNYHIRKFKIVYDEWHFDFQPYVQNPQKCLYDLLCDLDWLIYDFGWQVIL